GGAVLNLGYSLSRTGRLAQSALHYQRAHELWLNQINEAGGILGRLVEARVYDDESEPEKAAENYRRLIQEDGISILLGPCHTRLMAPVTQVAEQAQALLLQGTHGSHADFQPGLNHQFLCWPGCDFDYAKPFLEHLGRADARTAALVHTDGRIGQAVAAGTRHHADALCIGLVHDQAIGEPPFDYATLMARVKDTDPAALLIGLDHGRGDEPRQSCLKAAHDAGIPADMIWHSDNPSAGDVGLGAANEGVHMRLTWVPGIADPRSLEFAADFKSAYGEAAEFHGAGGFACGEVLAQAAEMAGVWEPDALRRTIRKGSFSTVVGPLRFRPGGLPECVLRVGRWENGRLRILDREWEQ
ncbi:MAG: ABC transporter substrate-binding protein, partial [Rhodospirillales bacterium]|nr:ABC transporter substrate-binding protein [Rhodospirillales bacterium]